VKDNKVYYVSMRIPSFLESSSESRGPSPALRRPAAAVTPLLVIDLSPTGTTGTPGAGGEASSWCFCGLSLKFCGAHFCDVDNADKTEATARLEVGLVESALDGVIFLFCPF
jgi:hypothetical protein